LQSSFYYFCFYIQAHLLIIVLFHILDLIEDDPLCKEAWPVWWYITKYVSMSGLCLLALWEIMQFVGKVVTCEIEEYFFSWQNVVDLLMISLSTAFFFLEEHEHCPLHDGSEYINSIY
jgi:hypothetical protein